jgi:hypothetical protein
MILHALNSAHPLKWWAVHAPTLTPLFVDATAGTHVGIHIHPQDFSPFRSHPQDLPSKQIATDAFASVRCLLAGNTPKFARPSLVKTPPADLPEYLPVFNHDGEEPAIWRTREPAIIIPAIPGKDYLLGAPSHWRTATDLPVSGWEYWWEDAQRAWDTFHAAAVAGASGS